MDENRKRIIELNKENLSEYILNMLLNSIRTNKKVPTVETFQNLLKMHYADVKSQANETQEIKYSRLKKIELLLPEAFKLANNNLENGIGMNLSELKTYKKELLIQLKSLTHEYNNMIANKDETVPSI